MSFMLLLTALLLPGTAMVFAEPNYAYDRIDLETLDYVRYTSDNPDLFTAFGTTVSSFLIITKIMGKWRGDSLILFHIGPADWQFLNLREMSPIILMQIVMPQIIRIFGLHLDGIRRLYGIITKNMDLMRGGRPTGHLTVWKQNKRFLT